MPTFTISRTGTACVALLSLLAHAQPSQLSDDEAKIKESRRLQTLALAKGDLDTVVKYWDPAITIRRALGHPVDGAPAARSRHRLRRRRLQGGRTAVIAA